MHAARPRPSLQWGCPALNPRVSRSPLRPRRVGPALAAALTAGGLGWPSTLHAQPGPAWTPEAEYSDTLFVTPGGDAVLAGPMLYSMIGGGDTAYEHASDPTLMGGGQHTKVGLSVQVYYSADTEGPDLTDPTKHMRYYINRGRSSNSMPLPPDVLSIGELPDVVRFGLDSNSPDDDLADWATLAKFPRTIAAIEWARYLNMPISFQLQTSVSHGGLFDGAIPGLSPVVYFPRETDLDAYTESRGADQCMWDVSDLCNVNLGNGSTYPANDPSQLVPSGATWGSFSFATPTLADSDLAVAMGMSPLPYRDLLMRNLADAIEQLVAIGNDPRYAGRFVAVAIDPEISNPSHRNDTYNLPSLSGPPLPRPFFEDYHPAMVREFAYYLRDRYAGDLNAFWDDFGADYLASGGFGHVHTLPTTWEDVDAPRDYPLSLTSPRSAYWQEWCNFQTRVLDEFLEELVDTAVEAGVPPSRIFTHQTLANGSYHPNRVNGKNQQWLDDWTHLESSRGYIGITQYQKFGVMGISGGKKNAYYENLARRDEAWGAPEYNPWVQVSTPYAPVGATLSEIQLILDKAWARRAQVLWMHSWGSPSHPAADVYTHYWTRDPITLLLQHPTSLEDWTPVNLIPKGGTWQATTANASYLEWPGANGPSFSYQAEDYPCLGVNTIAFDDGSPDVQFDMRVEFQAGGQWHQVVKPNWMRYGTDATHWWGIDLSREDPVNYSGTITGLRYHPVGHVDRWASVLELTLFGNNHFTTAMKDLLVAKRSTPRPALALLPVAPPLGARLDLIIPQAFGNGSADSRLVVYGNDPDANNTNYEDFGYAGNFYPATVTCGGVARSAIVAPASRLMGQIKTGRYRRLTLPNDAELKLRFGMGIVDGNASADGVRFRVLLRDHETRELVPVFSEEYRANEWAIRFADLSPWAGKTVDLLLETHAISNDTGDESAWAAPTFIGAGGGA